METKTISRDDKVANLTGIVRELIRDAMGTKDASSMLDIVRLIESHLYGLKSWNTHAQFKVKVGKVELSLLGGDIHACEQMTWDVGYNGRALEESERFGHLGESDYITTPEMLILLLKVAAL